jgi:hypothetical protein
MFHNAQNGKGSKEKIMKLTHSQVLLPKLLASTATSLIHFLREKKSVANIFN